MKIRIGEPSREASCWRFAVAIAGYGTVFCPRLFYGVGSGEHDAFMIAADVVRGQLTGEVINPLC